MGKLNTKINKNLFNTVHSNNVINRQRDLKEITINPNFDSVGNNDLQEFKELNLERLMKGVNFGKKN